MISAVTAAMILLVCLFLGTPNTVVLLFTLSLNVVEMNPKNEAQLPIDLFRSAFFENLPEMQLSGKDENLTSKELLF